MNITDLGRVLTAMAAAIPETNHPMRRAFQAGASKCVEIAQEQLEPDDTPQPVTEPEWIDHIGYGRPVKTSALVEVEFENMTRVVRFAAALDWHPQPLKNKRIMRYRLIDSAEQTG